jgi:hypothetical protein
MAGRNTYAGPQQALDSYELLIATTPGVDRRGAKIPYTSRNGHMFSFLDDAGSLALRLPSEAREEFLTAYRTSMVEQFGRVMKEYVVVPDALLKDTGELQPWFDRSRDYVGGLTPKPTTR